MTLIWRNCDVVKKSGSEKKINNDYCFDQSLHNSLNLKNLKLPFPKCYSTTLYELQLQQEKLFHKRGNAETGFHHMHITH
jgi:hypothetical protein